MGTLETCFDELMETILRLESLTSITELSEMELIEINKIRALLDRFREVVDTLEENETE
jgi:hypothetical protein